MGVQIATGDPFWAFDKDELERAVAVVAKNNGITTQTGWTAALNGGLTAAQVARVAEALCRAVKCSVP